MASCVTITGPDASIAVLDHEVVLVVSFTIASLSIWVEPLLMLLLLFVVDSVKEVVVVAAPLCVAVVFF